MSKTRSRLLRRRWLAAAQVLEDLRPRASVALAEAVAVDDNAVFTEGDLHRVLDDVEVPEHPLARMSDWERPTLVLPVLGGTLETL